MERMLACRVVRVNRPKEDSIASSRLVLDASVTLFVVHCPQPLGAIHPFKQEGGFATFFHISQIDEHRGNLRHEQKPNVSSNATNGGAIVNLKIEHVPSG